MNINLTISFSQICGELCNELYVKDYNFAKVNSFIDELNAKPFKSDLFARKPDASSLLTALCVNVKPSHESLVAKASHLISSIITKQNLQFDVSYLGKVISWYILCLNKCSDIIIPDILHNLQCILQKNPQLAYEFTDDLIGLYGVLIKLIDNDSNGTQNPLQICLIALKCVICCINIDDNNKLSEVSLCTEVKEQISKLVIKLLMKGYGKSQDEVLYCKVVISALRVLSNLYFNEVNAPVPLPEVMGICRHFILYGCTKQESKPEKLMPAQQTIAVQTIKVNPKGGKKQKLRKQRNKAIETLKKEIPASDRNLIKDCDSFDNHSTYKPVNKNYLEPQRVNNCWALTSDSDMSDVESSKEVKLVALKSRVRQSASNLLLVLIKVTERKDMFGFWWALFPDTPNADNWYTHESSRKTLAYCALIDPVASSRASVLSVILALLSGSRIFLSHAEYSKRDTTSFIPFSISLGYVITCMHKVLVRILDNERSHAIIIIALKCCAALVQSTPYHKMEAGLISAMVRATRKFLVHRDVTLQVGALITMGCVLSIDPKVDEILKAMEKDVTAPKTICHEICSEFPPDECDDFEEGYSDDELFTAKDDKNENSMETICFKLWILDVCFKNIGWIHKNNEFVKCKPSAIPLVLESLLVLSAIAYHYLSELLLGHLSLLADVLKETLQYDQQDVVLQTARTISIIGDALQKLEQSGQSPPLQQCVHMWETLLTPLSAVLQCHDNASAKAIVCDCIANIGERSFKELPRRLQVLCCTLLVGSCGDEEAAVRGAAVRALGMTVMYRSLREDIHFVSDCGENILRALSEPILVVRTKGAWALGNLSDALVLNMEEPDLDSIDDELLRRLLEVSIQCAADNDKVKMSATRGLGNFLRLINKDIILRDPQMKTLTESAIEKLMDCACKVANMKVRWNACYAIGNAMKNEHLFSCFNGWQRQVFTNLCTLCQECKNLKVRINAAVALRAPARAHYGAHFAAVWRGVMTAMENAANVDDYTEYQHKDNLIEQLCVTLAHMCCLMSVNDLADVLDPLVFHHECAKALFTQICHKLPPENSSCVKILQAAKYVTVDLTANNDTQSQSLSMLQDIFIWDI